MKSNLKIRWVSWSSDMCGSVADFSTNVLSSPLLSCPLLSFLDHMELVESCVQQSKTLMFVLTPASGSELTEQHPAGSQYSGTEGFSWQVRLSKQTDKWINSMSLIKHCIKFTLNVFVSIETKKQNCCLLSDFSSSFQKHHVFKKMFSKAKFA